MPAAHTSETLTWRGREYRIRGLTWEQKASSSLPASISITDGAGDWNASCEIEPLDGTPTGGQTPFTGGYPKEGEQVQITITYDGRKIAVYRPVVTRITYRAGSAHAELAIPFDSFSRKVRLPPVMSPMPPNTFDLEFGDPDRYRWCYPTPLWAVAEAFRTAGYHLTPPPPPNLWAEVTMQGAFFSNEWRKQGYTVRSVSHQNGAAFAPRMRNEEGLLWMDAGKIAVHNYTGKALPAGRIRLSFMVGKYHSALAQVYCVNDEKYALGVQVNADKSFTVIAGFLGQSFTKMLTVPAAAWSGDRVISMEVMNRQCRIHTGKYTGTVATTFDAPFLYAEVVASPGARIAGVQVSDPATGGAHPAVSHVQTANLGSGKWAAGLKASPGIRDQPAHSVLDEIAAATLSAWWVDGEGVAHFESAERLLTKPVAHELTALDDIADYQIVSDLQLRRSSVEVTYSEVALSYTTNHNVNLWSKGGTAKASDVLEEFVGPAAEEDWIDVDTTFNAIHSDPGAMNPRNGSWQGASKAGVSQDDPTVSARGYSMSCAEVVPWVWKIQERFSEDASREVPEHPAISRMLWGADTPIMRGRGRIERTDATVEAVGDSSPYAGTLTVDATRWVTDAERAQDMAAYLAERVRDPAPSLTDLTVRYTPAILMHDTVRVYGVMRDGSGNLFGAILRGTVEGVKHDPDAGTSTLAVRTLAEEYRTRTWQQVEGDVTARGMTWAELERIRTENTTAWADVEASPQNYTGG